MGWLRRRAWYLASIALGLAAIVIDWHSKSIVAAGVLGTAAATQAISHGATREVVAAMKEQAAAQVHRGSGMMTVGLIVAVASAVCFFISRTRSESGPRIAVIAVWIVYFFSFLVAV
jgi:hypothetical protein